jgi:hypothetical protein
VAAVCSSAGGKVCDLSINHFAGIPRIARRVEKPFVLRNSAKAAPSSSPRSRVKPGGNANSAQRSTRIAPPPLPAPVDTASATLSERSPSAMPNCLFLKRSVVNTALTAPHRRGLRRPTAAHFPRAPRPQ